MAPPSILAAFAAQLAANPRRPALIWRGRTLSYGDLTAQTARYRDRYLALGAGRGERVALYLGSSPSFTAAYLGAQLAGLTAVLVNTAYRRGELAHILGDSEPSVVVTDAAGLSELEAALADRAARPHVMVPPDEEPAAPPLAALDGPLPEPHELAVLAYTSGTTGRSKGAMLTHGALAANSAAVAAVWEWRATDRLLLTLPLFHIHGLGVGLHGTLLSGASLDLRPQFVAAEVLDALAQGEHTLFFGVPTMYTRLVSEAAERSGPLAPGVRLFVSGSAPLAPQTFAAFRQHFGHEILERYGMTETGMNLTNPLHGERRPGTVGGPFPGQEARVVELRSRQPVADGEVGEIQVRGPHVCAGYWRNPAATAELFHPDGWFSTGDLGWRSADGYYTITGRARELIISGGYNIYPREVEEALLSHPAVAECAVLGLPDADYGERVAAAVVPADPEHPPTTEALIAWCREQLAGYKRPRELRFVAALPRNALGKVEKHRIRAAWAGEHA